MIVVFNSSGPEYRKKEIYPSDWQNPAGYECKVVMKSEKEKEDQFALEKTAFVKREFSNNPIAQKIAKEKQLKILGWEPDEVEQVMAFEDQLINTAPVDPNNPNAGNPDATIDPETGQEVLKSPLQPNDLMKTS